MQDRKYLLNSLIGIALLLVLFSFFFIIHDAKRQEVGITGMAVFTQADENFIFTSWPQVIDQTFNFSLIDEMRVAGFTHVSIAFWPTTTNNVEAIIGELRDQNYKIALEISPGYYDGSKGESPELFAVEANDGNQFLKAPCLIRQDKCIALGCTFSGGKCQNCPITEEIANNWSDYVDKERCKSWNNTNLALDPSYTGVLWENTLNNTKNVTKRANPDIVLFDPEYWQHPTTVEYYFTTGDYSGCSCNVVQEGITKDNYYKNWSQRYLELKNVVKDAVKQVDPSKNIEVYFFGDIEERGGTWWRNPFDESYVYLKSDYLSENAGDYPNPNYYFFPNLELLEKNIANGLSGAVPWVSFVYMDGHSNYFDYYYNKKDANRCSDLKGDIRFDPSVSREAGRMLRKAGARGFIIYPNKDTFNWGGTCLFNSYGDYWLNHSREMIAGFLEEGYIEKNKIRNPGFESWKTKADSIIEKEGQQAGLANERFIPVFWSWGDTNPDYNDSVIYADLTTDKQSGMYAWRHTRLGDIGTRTILSRNFSIEPGEEENYTFSIWTKKSMNSGNGKIKFFLVNDLTLAEEAIGETSFQASWNEFKENLYINSGNYQLKIFIEDNTGQKVDIFFDGVSLMQGSIAIECGDGSCNGNENCSNCPQDCGNCSLINETCQERGYFCLASVNCSSTDRLNYDCDSGVCCSKLPTNNTIIIQQDKTCAEQNGRICNSTQYCTGAIGWAKDGDCCLGECVEGSGITECKAKGNTCRETCLTNETQLDYYCDDGVCCGEEEKPESYWMYGIIGLLIAGIVGAGFVIASKLRKGREQGKVNEEIGRIILVKEAPIVSEKEKQNQEKIRAAEEFVSTLKSRGYGNDFVKKLFLDKGWSEEVVEELLK